MDYPTSDLILQDDNLRNNEYHIMGLNKSTIDFSILKTTLPKEFYKTLLDFLSQHKHCYDSNFLHSSCCLC